LKAYIVNSVHERRLWSLIAGKNSIKESFHDSFMASTLILEAYSVKMSLFSKISDENQMHADINN